MIMDVKFVLRLPKKSHLQVKRGAKQSNTSMNKEIANILDGYYNGTPIEDRLAQLETTVRNKLKKK